MENPSSPARPVSYVWIYWFATVLVVLLMITGVFDDVTGKGPYLMFVAFLAAVVLLVGWAVGDEIAATRRAMASHDSAVLSLLNDRLPQITTLLTTLSDQQLLSDRAKAVAFRTKDREALRRAIREEMAAKDWNAALVLANEMEKNFGYSQEAAELRTEINNNQHEVISKQLDDAMVAVAEHIRGERWSAAMREAERLGQMYPTEPRAQALTREIESRRQGLKRQLQDGFHDAISRHDVDGGIEILKRLDPYLTPAEAEAMQEQVRALFKEKLNILKANFTTAYQQHNAVEALKQAEIIVRDFPNSRIALELRDTMDVLRQQATPAAAAAV